MKHLDLHQCKQCGIVYRAITKPVFSWDKKFMIDKCKACIEFGYRSLFLGMSIWWQIRISSTQC